MSNSRALLHESGSSLSSSVTLPATDIRASFNSSASTITREPASDKSCATFMTSRIADECRCRCPRGNGTNPETIDNPRADSSSINCFEPVGKYPYGPSSVPTYPAAAISSRTSWYGFRAPQESISITPQLTGAVPMRIDIRSNPDLFTCRRPQDGLL